MCIYIYIQRIDVCLMYAGRFQSGSCQWGIRVPGAISDLQELQSYAARNLWLLSNLSNLRSRLNATDIKPDLGMVDYNYPSKFPCTLPMFYIVLHHLPICYLVYLRHFVYHPKNFTVLPRSHGPPPSAPETVSGRQRPCRYRMDVVDLYPLPIPFFLMVKSIFQGGSVYMGLKMD